MENIIIGAVAAAVDRLYWAVFGFIIMRTDPPRGPGVGPLLEAVLSGVGGAVGAFAISQLTGQRDLLTAVVGAFIGGRLVGGAIDMFRGTQRQ
jgi:hypothetical protein